MRCAYECHAGTAGKRDGVVEADFVADSDTARADDTQVVVAVVERVVGVDRQVTAVVQKRRVEVQFYRANGVFEFTNARSWGISYSGR